ncbi:MAG: hypothetical protein R3E39_22330 [Anaerolineae bacterium]
MAQEERERIHVVRGAGIEQKRRVVESAPSTRQVLVSRFTKFMWLIATIIVVMLATRFVLVLINANPATEFVQLIMRVTQGLVQPFSGIVNTPGVDVAAVIAILVVVVIFWVVTYLFRLLFSDTRRVKHVTTVDYRS